MFERFFGELAGSGENAEIDIRAVDGDKMINPLVPDPRQFWKLLYDQRNTQMWNQAFLLLELCLCVPYSKATLERFFSQMHVVKTDSQNQLNEKKFNSFTTSES